MKFLYIIIAAGILLSSCEISKKNDKTNKNNFSMALNDNEGLKLMQQNCYACHSITTKSHDEIIAPPMVAIKRRYLMSYPNKKEFMEAFTNWVINPKEENALMRGAVMKFKVMPKQNFNKNDIEQISEYIFESEIETPIWFQSHFNSQHSNGMRNGKGRGNRFFN